MIFFVVLANVILSSCKSSTERKLIGKWKMFDERITCTNPIKKKIDTTERFKRLYGYTKTKSLEDDLNEFSRIELANEDVYEFYDNHKYIKMEKLCIHDCYSFENVDDSMVLRMNPDYSFKQKYRLEESGIYEIRNDSLILHNDKGEESEDICVKFFSENKVKFFTTELSFNDGDGVRGDYHFERFFDKVKEY